MKLRTMTIGGALVLAGAAFVMWSTMGGGVPDVVWISEEGVVALDPAGDVPAEWTSGIAQTSGPWRRRRTASSYLVVPLSRETGPPTIADRLREWLGQPSARAPLVYARCDLWDLHPAPRWSPYVWSGWTDAEYAAAAAKCDAITAARERGAARVGEDRFRALGGRPPERFQSPR